MTEEEIAQAVGLRGPTGKVAAVLQVLETIRHNLLALDYVLPVYPDERVSELTCKLHELINGAICGLCDAQSMLDCNAKSCSQKETK